MLALNLRGGAARCVLRLYMEVVKVDIHEYQAKALLARYGVATPRGEAATSPADAEQAARKYGGRAVVKAQVHAGGRGKAGGVKIAANPAEAAQFAAEMLGKRLVTHQTTPAGVPIQTVLIEEAIDIVQEIYLSVLVDGDIGAPVVVSSAEGGMNIERLAAEAPDKIVRVHADPFVGLSPYKARDAALALGLPPNLVRPLQALIGKLYRAFIENDCALIELNPLAITADGALVAADAKVAIEDDALFRQPRLAELRDSEQMDALERRAAAADLAYVKLDAGRVGCMVNGAGLAMATMDITLRAGARPANFLDIGGSAKQERIEEALRIVLADGDVEVILVNLFAGIARADVVARGIAAVYESERSQMPIVVVLRGTNADEGAQILENSAAPASFAESLTAATDIIKDILS